MKFTAAERPTVFDPIPVSMSGVSNLDKRDTDEEPSFLGIRQVRPEAFKEPLESAEEYSLVKRELEDFLYSESFRAFGRERIPDKLIEALERFHQRAARMPHGEATYKGEIRALEGIIMSVSTTSSDPAQRQQMEEAVRELSDLVRDAFVCHGVWIIVSAGKIVKNER